jgi:anti-anti-sigma factor
MSEVRARIFLKHVGPCLVVHFADRSLVEDEDITEVGQALVSLVENPKPSHLIVNLDGLDFYRSMFLTYLLRLREKIEAAQGQLAIVQAPESFSHKTFEVAGMARKVFVIHPTEEAALANCR